jgi:DeoR/GlpR family transcriptional regulator of sugar metabolism
MKAAELVYDGDSIALDVGTTTLEMVPGLRGKRNLTIVTSCLQVATKVVDQISLEIDARLILTGGIVRPRELSMIGSIPERVYQDLHVDKAFIGIGGVSLEDGFTEYNLEDTQIKRMLIRSAREKIVLADGAKFGVTTFASVAALTAIDKIVTDRSAPLEMIEQIHRQGVEIILAD